jgi:hypothetical protein
MGEFERVHYPLPMNYIDEPEPESLRKTIERMKNQILMQKSNTFSVKSAQDNLINRYDDFT